MPKKTEYTSDEGALKLRVQELELEIQNIRLGARKREEELEERLQLRDRECRQLETDMNRKKEEFDEYKRNVDDSFQKQFKVYEDHNKQVATLKRNSMRDRAWLEEETARRRAASELLRKQSEAKVEQMGRRLSLGW